MSAVKKYIDGHSYMFHGFWIMIVTAVSLTAYAFTNFSTKAEVFQNSTVVEKRLDRIESKIDHLIDHQLPRRNK